MKDVNIYIYTEYTGNLKSGTGKYHVILESLVKTKDGEKPATLKEMDILENITRNRLELQAAVKGLSHLKVKSRVIIHTTSDYVVGIFTQECLKKWKRNGYKTKGKSVKHADLWKSIAEQMENHDITFAKALTTPYMRAQAVELRNFKKKDNMQREAENDKEGI